MSSSPHEDPKAAAENAHRRGDFAEAIRLQREVVARSTEAGDPAVRPRKLLSLYCYSGGEYEEALRILGELRELVPEDLEVLENTGVILRLVGRLEEAVEVLEAVFEKDPSRFNVCDALAHCCAGLGNGGKMQEYGRASLEQKDRFAAELPVLRKIPEGGPPPFFWDGAKKNVISFSLWGDHPRYLRGAIRNAQAAVDVYPGWVCRFYCDDSVPAAVLDRLRRHGAEVVMRPRPESFFDGLLWRFEVVADPGVGRFLIRDCDSVVNVKERVAVDDWIGSGKWFHAMRDFPSHTELILAGMWGGVSGVLPPVEEIRKAFHPKTAPTRTFDQVFLRECVWPMIRGSVLIHDSVYTGCLGSVPFPGIGGLPPKFHVGQNEAAVRPDVFVDLPGNGAGMPRMFLLAGLDDGSVGHCRKLLEEIPGVRMTRGPTVPELRGLVEGFSAGLRELEEGAGGSERDEALSRELLLASLRSLSRGEEGAGCRALGFEDPEGRVEELSELAAELRIRLLCVIRDPRDIASARRIATPEEGAALGRQWNHHIEAIVAANRRRAGAVELVRYEDLAGRNLAATMLRLAQFLGVGAGPAETAEPGRIDTGKPLPEEIASAIEGEAAAFLEKLRYARPSAMRPAPGEASATVTMRKDG